MKLGPIVLKLRLANTRFENRVGGAAELDLATKYTITQEMAFVVPVMEECSANEYDAGIGQLVTEQFGVIVACKNDTYQQDKAGLLAYDSLHAVRNELFSALLGWEVSWAESFIYYRGGSILLVTPAYLWYMYKFELKSRVAQRTVGDPNSGAISNPIPGADLVTRDVVGISDVTDATPAALAQMVAQMVGINSKGQLDLTNLNDFDTLYVNYVLGDDIRLFDGSITELPLKDGYPNVTFPDQAQWIDMTQPVDPNAGAFMWNAFRTAFERYKYFG